MEELRRLDRFVTTPISDMQHSQHGFIALISILIVSAVLLATTLSLAQFGIANRFFILHLEEKVASEKRAEACVHIARIAAYNDPLYEVSSPTSITVAGGTCSIVNVEANDDESTIEVSAVSNGATTNYRVVVDNTDGTFLSWHEVTGF